MGWNIECTDQKCGRQTWASNIVTLIAENTDRDGWFRCACGDRGYVAKKFELQEQGETWAPFLRGVIPLGTDGDTYQPFVFLVSYEPRGEVTDVWFSYYKDLRPAGGRLKLGHGPGGPPVLDKAMVLSLITRLMAAGCVTQQEVAALASGSHRVALPIAMAVDR